MKPTSFSLSLAAVSSRAIAAASNSTLPPLPAWYPLEPWAVSSFSISHPKSGPYDANATSLLVTISNPKHIPAARAPHARGGGYITFQNSTAQCELHWTADANLSPMGGLSANRCVSDIEPSAYSFPQWVMTLREVGVDPQTHDNYFVDISFDLTHNATIYGTQAFKHMISDYDFRAGADLNGQCDDKGCKYNLKDKASPVSFLPLLESCETVCG
ncbi:hypothetical protein GGS21DRAFT_41072 [Xylaria nigripes]|nr:hypothetical protein GGS21DRAFT_41072 [Xylaria nigripes]